MVPARILIRHVGAILKRQVAQAFNRHLAAWMNKQTARVLCILHHRVDGVPLVALAVWLLIWADPEPTVPQNAVIRNAAR